jgi:tyrosyl-tRNA synthetase
LSTSKSNAVNLVEELKWRNMLQDMTPGTEEQLSKEMTSAYIGFDPTADSLHIGNMVPIMLLTLLQRSGHKPLVLVGGATGRVGDPSGKKAERKLLSLEDIQHNLESQKAQLQKFLNFDAGENKAELVNNYDWFKDISFLDFIRDVGKHISVNYMMAKDSVKSRLEQGISFTEFSYQLVQGYDFYHLFANNNCLLQMGGSDQWGNITTGTELIRRMMGKEAYALTAKLLTKSDGSKFGKSEGGNVWLDPKKTSPYKFYQYWLNVADEDAFTCIRFFSLKTHEDIEAIEKEQREAPHTRALQRALAEEMTIRVHSEEELENAKRASNILFGKSTSDDLKALSEQQFLEVFEGVPQATISRTQLKEGLNEVFVHSGFLKSNSELRRALSENSLSINKNKITEDSSLTEGDLLDNKYLLLQRGKRNYFILSVS